VFFVNLALGEKDNPKEEAGDVDRLREEDES
jgi:hypothetical protein